LAQWDSVSKFVHQPRPLARTFDGLAAATGTAVVAVFAGAALGFIAVVDLRLATALTVAVLVGLALILKPSLLLPTLVTAVFLEVVSLGGLGIVPLLAPIALLALVAAASRAGMEIRAGAPLVWAFAYATWAVASGLWTVSLGGTSFLLGSLAVSIVFMLSFAGLLTSERQLERVLYAFTFAALGIGAFAIAAFAFGLSENLEAGRSTGGTGDPNIFAAYQVVALPLAIVLATRVQKRWEKTVAYLAVIVVIGSVLTSVSRGGVLTLLAVTLILLAMPARSVFRSGRHKAIFATAAVVATAISLAFAAGKIIPRLEAVFSDDAAATAESRGSGRKELWATAWRSFHDRPLHGLGFGAFADVSNELIVQTPGVSFQHFELRPHGSEVHNVYLGSLAEVGVVGLSLFLGLLISTAVALRRTARRARASGNHLVMRVANALLLSLFGFAVASAFLSSETSRPLWIVVGLSLALPKLIATGGPGRTRASL
jgi:putative inorganic carbon (hco3(-)) transporter